MKIDQNQMAVFQAQMKQNQFIVVGDLDGGPPHMSAKFHESTPEQLGKAFGQLAAMAEHYFMQMRDAMREDKDSVRELEAYYEDARKKGYSPQD